MFLKKISTNENDCSPAERKKTNQAHELKPSFLNAGLAGMCATCVTHPMDVLKNRMQMNREGITLTQVCKNIYRNEGCHRFYAGLSAGLMRQVTYTSSRVGISNYFMEQYNKKFPSEEPPFGVLALIAAASGYFSAFIGTPSEVALVRMSSDGRLPPEHRRKYKNVYDALVRMVRDEGAGILWRGSLSTMARGAVVNASQLATYSEAKFFISHNFNIEEGFKLHVYSSMVSGMITAFNSMPLDMLKTRLQNLQMFETQPSMICLIHNIIKTEGLRALWKGYWPYYGRIGPQTVITFVVIEHFNRVFRW